MLVKGATSDAICRENGSTLVPDGTKPLPESMLTDHQWDSYNGNFTRDASTIMITEISLKITYNFIQISQGPNSYGCMGNKNHLTSANKLKYCHHDEIFATDCTGNCQKDDFICCQWREFHQNGDIFVTVLFSAIFMSRSLTGAERRISFPKSPSVECWYLSITGSDNGLFPGGTKPIPELMLTPGELCLYMASQGHNELTLRLRCGRHDTGTTWSLLGWKFGPYDFGQHSCLKGRGSNV